MRSERFTEKTLRVVLRPVAVFDEPVGREVLKRDPRLVGLYFLRAPMGTNFPLSEAEVRALVSLSSEENPPRVVKVAPGEEGRFWEDCRDGGYVCVGWDDVGDLTRYETKDAFREAFGEHYPYNNVAGAVTKKANELWTLQELEPGDLVVANKGMREVLAVGEVLEPGYVWRPERSEYKHTVNVRWDTGRARTIPKQKYWGLVTVADVPIELYRAIVSNSEEPKSPETTDQNTVFASLVTALQDAGLYFSEEVLGTYLLALQTKRFALLTGISGTGKTQLALAVAKQLGSGVARQRVTEFPEGAFEFTTKPSYLKYNGMVLPRRVRSAMRIPDGVLQGNSARIAVAWPGGTGDLYIGLASTNAVEISFSGAFRRWFQANVAVLDPFYIQLEEVDEDQPHRLRFGVPDRHVREVTEEPRYAVVSVRPDWTDNRGLLGYYNPVLQEYVTTEFLRLMLRATAEEQSARREERTSKPFFVILDEMNLARVEHYFSDFLSSLESGEPIYLHNDDDVESGENSDSVPVPKKLAVPGNLFFTGTVNVDETTYMFSPKVIDRAFTLELNVVDLEGFSSTGVAGEQDARDALHLVGLPALLESARSPSSEDWQAFGALHGGDLQRVVLDVHQVLERHGRHFGYRVANEIARFVMLASEQASSEPEPLFSALDLAVLLKVLPKFHGTQQELEPLLAGLFELATSGDLEAALAPEAPFDGWSLERDGLVAVDAPGQEKTLPRTAAKLYRMAERLRQRGFTSFIE